jgi:hypothetical protein
VLEHRAVWDGDGGESAWKAAVERARVYLALKRPVVLELEVTDSFVNAGADGLVVPAAGEEKVHGAHAACVCGLLLDKDLPKALGLPKAAGGGWLVVKNSWGTRHGDDGYVYLDLAWARRHALTMTALWALTR